jgi:DNA-binding NtrC family response regulator
MARIFISWIGKSDLNANLEKNDPGPVLRFLREKRDFDCIYLLNDIQSAGPEGGQRSAQAFTELLAKSAPIPKETIRLCNAEQALHNQLAPVWFFTRDAIKRISSEHRQADWTVLLSPGFPAAQAAMMIASEVLFDPGTVEAWNSTQSLHGTSQGGIERVALPFVLSIDVIPRIVRHWQRAGAQAEIGPAFQRIKGDSEAIRGAIQQAQRAAGVEVNVLLWGERGAGKELFARAIHDASPRSRGPYVEVNCAALSETLLESELFGHEPGAFTGATKQRIGRFEEAREGTLFLDEVGEMSAAMQAKLLRVLDGHGFQRVGGNQTIKTDVRIVAATNRDLSLAAAKGEFRDDLYDRLNRYLIRLPALCERRTDVPVLARHFLAQANQKFKLQRGFSDDALAHLARYTWPGNVRQLQNRVERLAIDALTDEITAEDVEVAVEGQPAPQYRALRDLSPVQFMTHLAAVADELIERYAEGGMVVDRPAEKYDIFDEVVGPVLYGRALRKAGTKTGAGELLSMGPNKPSIDMSKPDHKRRLMRYLGGTGDESSEGLQQFMNEDEVQRIRNG